MDQFLNKVSRFLRTIDMFGIPNSLVLGRTIIYRSKLSGLVSFIVYMSILSIFLFECQKIWNKETYGIQNYVEYDLESSPIMISLETFFPAFRIKSNNKNEEKLLHITAEYVINDLKSNGNQNKTSKVIQLEQCSEKHTMSIKNSINKDQVLRLLDKINHENWKCLKINSTFNLSGSETSQMQKYLKINFFLSLTNDTVEYNNKSFIEIEFLHLNYLIRSNDLHDSAKMYLNDIESYQINPRKQQLLSKYFFRKQIFEDHSDYFSSSKYTQSEYFMRKEYDKRINEQILENDELQNNQQIATIYLVRSPYTHKSIRTFYQVENMLSYIGGMISFIFTLGQIIMGWYNEVSFLKTIANNCYNFVEENSYKEAREQAEKQMFERHDYNTDIIAFNNANIFSALINKVKIQLFDALAYFCDCIQKFNLKKRVYSVGMEMIYRDFNILRLIRAMHDIERIKSILMNEEQLELFNSLPKPLVLIKLENQLIIQRKSIMIPIPIVKEIREWAQIIPKFFDDMFSRLFYVSRLNVDTFKKKQQFEREKLIQLFKILQKQQLQKQKIKNKLGNFIKKQMYTLIDHTYLQFLSQNQTQSELSSLEIKEENQISSPIIQQEIQNFDYQQLIFKENDQQLNFNEILAMIIVESGVIIQNQYLTINFVKTIDKQSNQIMIIFTIRSSIEKIKNIDIEQKPKSLMTLGINKKTIESNSYKSEFEIYFCVNSVSVKNILRNQNVILISTLFNINESAQLNINFLSHSVSIKLPIWNIEEQFFTYSQEKVNNDIFWEIFNTKSQNITFIYNYKEIEQISIKIQKEPFQKQIIQSKIQKDNVQLQFNINFFIEIIKYIVHQSNIQK